MRRSPSDQDFIPDKSTELLRPGRGGVHIYIYNIYNNYIIYIYIYYYIIYIIYILQFNIFFPKQRVKHHITEIAHDYQATIKQYVVRYFSVYCLELLIAGTLNVVKELHKICAGLVRTMDLTWFH